MIDYSGNTAHRENKLHNKTSLYYNLYFLEKR